MPSVPVSISDALYASVGFPFAVQVPAESGVKAYYATAAAGGELTLSEIADGIIPAYTGAILAATAATEVNLAIVTTDKSLDNKLVAATAKRTGFAENANYMLGVDSDSEVKFLQATITTVPANKAYLPAANVTNGRSAPDLNHLREVGSPRVLNVIFFIVRTVRSNSRCPFLLYDSGVWKLQYGKARKRPGARIGNPQDGCLCGCGQCVLPAMSVGVGSYASGAVSTPLSVALEASVMRSHTRSPGRWFPRSNTTTLFCSVRPKSCSRERLLTPSTSTS